MTQTTLTRALIVGLLLFLLTATAALVLGAVAVFAVLTIAGTGYTAALITAMNVAHVKASRRTLQH